MQQKKTTTALQTQSRRKLSSAKQPSGLIATAKTATQSAGTKSALDNRSHRTTDKERERFFVSGFRACQWYQGSLFTFARNEKARSLAALGMTGEVDPAFVPRRPL